MFVKKFSEINKTMSQECGGKAAHLGELTALGVNVPNGFCVVGESYYHHMETNNLREKIAALADNIDFDDFEDIEVKTSQIRAMIHEAPIDKEVEKEIIDNYENLSQDTPTPFVAIRSSVAVIDSDVSSFPGMMDTYHYIKGGNNVVENVKNCWASVWTRRATFARFNKKIDNFKAIIAPIIQLMVNSECAGVAFTRNPVNGQNEVVIESNWGLGEAVVSGRCLCDFCVTDKVNYDIKQKRIAPKEETFIQLEGGGSQWVKSDPEMVNKPSITDTQIKEIGKTACMIEDHYGLPQDIEWAYEKGRMFILQTRTARVAGE